MRIYRLFILSVLLCACARVTDTNIALHRAAKASSNYDYNLTAQLVTDGIVLEGEPAFLEVLSSDGPVTRVERENALDGDMNSRNIITGTEGFLQWKFSGYDVKADEAEVLYQEALKGGRGGPETTVKLPVQTTEDGALRIEPVFPHEGRWRIKNVEFYSEGKPLGNLLPSERFTSAWMSEGNAEGENHEQEEWIMVDLGSVRRINEVRPQWIYAPAEYRVEVSRNGEKWKPFRKGKWRFVRLVMKGSGRFCLTELEVLGPEKCGKSGQGEKAGKGVEAGQDMSADWMIQRSSEVKADAAEISSTRFDTKGWLPATVPGTVLANYIRAGAVPDPAIGDNVSQISDSYFNSDFWYRREFEYTRKADKRAFLDFDGINWKADVWLNGSPVGRIEGAFMRGHFDVDSLLKDGTNVLAVKIERNAHPGAVKEKTARWTGYNGGVLGADNPTFHASIGWDWMTTVRGRNCGIWNDVRIVEKGPVEVSDPLISSIVNPEGSASITASIIVKGISGDAQLEGWIGDVKFSKAVTADGLVTFTPEEYPQLKDCKLDLWWPVGYGEPVLHDAGFAINANGSLSDSLHFKAGIREVTWDTSDEALKLFVNGKRFVPQGGNWGFSEQNLMFGEREYDIALDYHRQMGLNMIRNWVGQIGDEEFYQACDRHGVMVWQDFWLANPGDGPNPDNEDMFLANAKDLVQRIRRHPSLALYCGRNEGYPPETLDKALRSDVVAALHPGMLYISSSADDVVSGHGPYKAMPTSWYFEHQSGKLHSERGLPNVTTWESLQRMMPSAQDQWPQGEMWGKHDFTTDGAQSVKSYNALVEEAFGKASSAREFTFLSQWLNYEGCRAIFESANSSGRMGVLLWMTHSSWPSLVFCTYDYWFEPGGAFFGCKKGCEPLHIQYNSASGEVEVVNLSCGQQEGLTAELGVYNRKGEQISVRSATIDIPEDSTVSCFTAELPDNEQVYLLKLRLLDADGALLSENFYMKGDLKALRTLPSANISKKVVSEGREVKVLLRNEDSVPAILVRLILQDGKGNEILPANYSDNYFALLPGEEKTVVISSGPTSVISSAGETRACERWLQPKSHVALQQLGDFRRTEMDLTIESVADLSARQCLLLGSSVEEGSMPQTFEDGQLVTSDLVRWTSGFFPGTCWYSSLLSGSQEVRALAEKFTEPMLDVDSYYRDHDIGFQIMCSAGLAYKITGDEKYLPAIRRGAELLASRFCPASGTIMSWNSSRPVCKVIIDNMMNLELLTFASKQFDMPRWRDIAVSHADNTMANHFREDGSSYHLLEYDLQTGEILVKKTVQGYADDSAWSRGQSWGLYGYTMMFRETGEKRYLAHAEKIAGFLLPLLAERPVPAWDFNAPDSLAVQADASAAAVMASAMIELSGLTKDKALGQKCLHQAEATLLELASPKYLAAPGELGGFLLKHSTGFYKKGSEVDVPLTYADYYFLEALWRYNLNLKKD